jgi:glycosyltransferase involved in cell wall biosynthesis
LNYPLISCICITKCKPHLLQRAINCFSGQSYPNKEIIIAYEKGDNLTKSLLEKLSPSNDLVTIEVDPSLGFKLGYLRNLAIQMANGQLIAQWDDDDWYHRDRLLNQFTQINNSEFWGCVMTQWIVFNSIDQKVFLSNVRLWEGSLLCEKNVFDTCKYSNMSSGEDTPIVEQLFTKSKLGLITDLPHMYIYIYHGANTCNTAHWNYIFSRGRILDENIAGDIKKIIDPLLDVSDASDLLDEILLAHPIL